MIAALIALLAVVNSPVNSVTYACDGTTAAYTVNFPYLSSGDLVVTSTTGPGVATTLVQTTDWSVNLSSTSSTASLTLNSPSTKCPVGNTLKIVRTLAVTQPTSFRAQTTYSPSVHEQAYDRAAMIAQQQATSIATNASGIATANSNLVTETANRVSADTATNTLLASDLAAMSAGGAPGVAASNSTVIATGATAALALKDVLQAVGYNLAYFLPAGYVTDCSVDYTAQFNAAITATQNSVVTHTLRLPKICIKVTAALSTAGINVIGESGAAFTPANTLTEIDCYGAGACLTFASTNNGGGNRFEGISFASKAAGQSGAIIENSFGIIRNVGFKDFDTNCFQMGIANVVGAFYSDVSNVVCSNGVNQAVRGVLVSGGTPASNANSFRNIVVNGKFTTLFQIDGTKNIFWGGDLDPSVLGTGVSNLWLINGTENEINGPYVEAGGGTLTTATKIVNFGSSSFGNIVRDVNYTMPMTTYGTQTSAISDAGWSNRVSFRGVGFNFPMTSENRGIANLVPNSGFQQWDTSGLGQPLGWVAFGGTFAQDTTTTHGTSTSLKMTAVSAATNLTGYIVSPSPGDKSLNQIPIGYFLGKQMTCSVWCKSSFAGVGNLRAGSNGTGGADYGAMTHTGSGNWELLVATALIPTDATKVDISFRNSNGGALLNGDIWFSEPICTISPEVPHYAPRSLFDTVAQMMGPLIEAPPTTLTYGVAVATDASQNNSFLITVTNGVAFTISNPTNLKSGQLVLYTLANTSGGVMGAVTLGATFKAPTLVLPATGTNRSYQFQYNGTNLRFLWQTASDVPN